MESGEILEALLSKHKSFAMGANGRSMAPFLVKGDQLLFERDAALRVGDVALCKTPSGRFLIHRVCSLSPFRTKGDNAAELDEPGCVPVARLMRVEKTWRSNLRRYTLLLWRK